MEKNQIMEKIEAIFSNTLSHGNFNLNETTTANDVDGWESITHMMIMNEVEKEFNLKFSLMELLEMKNIGDLVISIQRKLA